jgi:hypothetical protein
MIRRGVGVSNGRYWIQKELSMLSYPQRSIECEAG